MPFLVTGASGFIGGALARRLAGCADRVAGLDLCPPRAPAAWRHLPGPLGAAAGLYPAEWPAPDAIVHCAGITATASEADPDAAFAANVEGTRALLAWCRTLPAPPRFVLASTVAVFGGGEPEPDEASRPCPSSTYGTTKAMAEALLADATRRGEVEGVVLRLPVTLLRRSRAGRAGAGYLSPLILAAATGRPFTAPLPADRAIPVALLGPTVSRLVGLATAPDPPPLVHVPSLAATGEAVLTALERCGIPARSLVRFEPDPELERLLAGWPARLRSLGGGGEDPADVPGLVAACLAELGRPAPAGAGSGPPAAEAAGNSARGLDLGGPAGKGEAGIDGEELLDDDR